MCAPFILQVLRVKKIKFQPAQKLTIRVSICSACHSQQGEKQRHSKLLQVQGK